MIATVADAVKPAKYAEHDTLPRNASGFRRFHDSHPGMRTPGYIDPRSWNSKLETRN